MTATREAKSYCRMCWAFCGMTVTIEEDRVIAVRGDRSDPVSRGFACFKGLQAPEQHNSDKRLLRALHRVDGELVETDTEAALRQAGDRLAAIVEAHGPWSVGFFNGTQTFLNTLNAEITGAFAAALQTPRNFVTMTIDQSSKWITEQRLGTWGAGTQDIRTADVWLMVGNNPLVSMSTAGGPEGFVLSDPVKTLKEARARGFKLIVIDPRRTETAAFADLFIQPRPGTDAELLASILHVILREGWHDHDFCDSYVDGLGALREQVAPFAPERCAEAIGVTADEIRQAARMFARDARSGMAGSATGTAMARFSNLTEHLVAALNVACGRFPREGEPVSNPGVLAPGTSPRAQVNLRERREWESGPRSCSHGTGLLKGTMMSADLADEILHRGEQRMRALICIGGNPAVALPDQAKAERALQELELLIVIDPRLSATARFADYVFPPKMQYERADHTGVLERLFQQPYGHITPALVPPPPGSDLVEDWYVLWSLARRLGCGLRLRGQEVPMDEAPAIETLLDMQMAAARIPPAQVRAGQGGGLFPGETVRVGPRQNDKRFQLTPPDVAEELASLAAELARGATVNGDDDTFQLTVRRHRETMNSTAADFDAVWQRLPGNAAYFHESDLARLGIAAGTQVEIVRGAVRLAARAAIDNGMRPGVVSVGHCRPGTAERPWEATNALVDSENELQSINRMPVMTGFRVRVEAAEG